MKKGWEVKKLGDVCQLITDGTHNSPQYVVSGIPMLDSRNINDYFQIDDSKPDKYISIDTDRMLSRRCKPKENDILISSRGTIGKIAIVRNGQNFNIMGNMILLRLNEGITPKFIALALYANVNYIESIAKGSSQKGLYLNQIRNIYISLPPLPEQQRIVAILDEVLSAIDKAKENAGKNLNNARELFDSYLQSVFANPADGWEEKTLDKISDNLDSKRVPITKSIRRSGIYPYYGASGIVDYVDGYIFHEDLLLISEDGANLVARTTPIAFSVSGKIWVNNHAHVLRFDNLITQKFVELFFASIKIDKYITGTAQPKLNQAALNSIIIPIPPISVQECIVNKLKALSAETKKLEAIYKQKLADLEELKKSILEKAFKGEL